MEAGERDTVGVPVADFVAIERVEVGEAVEDAEAHADRVTRKDSVADRVVVEEEDGASWVEDTVAVPSNGEAVPPPKLEEPLELTEAV